MYFEEGGVISSAVITTTYSLDCIDQSIIACNMSFILSSFPLNISV